MKQHHRTWLSVALILGTAFLLAWAGPGVAAFAAGEPECFPCAAEDRMEKEVTPDASLEELTCYMKRYEGVDTLHFKVTLKNAGNEPKRFRVNIFLDNGKAVGGLIPSSTKGGLVEPGASASFVYPVLAMPDKPESVLIRITTMTP